VRRHELKEHEADTLYEADETAARLDVTVNEAVMAPSAFEEYR